MVTDTGYHEPFRTIRFGAEIATVWRRAAFTFDSKDLFTSAHQLEAYERMMHDVLIADRTLFTRADRIASSGLVEAFAPLLANLRASDPYALRYRRAGPQPTGAASSRAAGTSMLGQRGGLTTAPVWWRPRSIDLGGQM